MVGKTRRVSVVEVIKPPITTVANGRCTSAPELLEIAMGMNPNAPQDAVIKTGRNRSIAP